MHAHMDAKTMRHKSPLGGNDPEARARLAQARDLRLEAYGLDPDRTSPQWALEQGHSPVQKDTHTLLLAFYAQQLDEVPA
jgi:hypothetical protein